MRDILFLEGCLKCLKVLSITIDLEGPEINIYIINIKGYSLFISLGQRYFKR